jgi:hypothetical protein
MAVEARPRETLYSSKIIKAAALLPDTRTLFGHWNTALSTRENLDAVRRKNLFAKASRARVDDVLAIFRQRYLADEGIARALAILVQGEFPAPSLARIFYFHAAQADALLHDVVTDLLAPQQWAGNRTVTPADVRAFVATRVREGRTVRPWSESTIAVVVRELLATLRDFGVLAGAAKKRLAAGYLAVEAFAYVAFVLARQTRSGDLLVNSPEWRLFFLHPTGVERYFVEAQQQRLLQYHAAGRVVRVDFPAASIEEYARALAERAY